ncbi:MAG: extracellular solute-binding protein [Methyloligellaceae bacterium]
MQSRPILPLLASALIALFASVIVVKANDANQKHHALSLIGEPKYPADYSHFDYVNPDAPKGGVVRLSAFGSYDSLNPIVFKGVSASGLGLIYETLMADSIEESSTSYGLIAEWVSHPEDFSSVTFKLRDTARWHDGKPITVDDVIFSLEMQKKGNPRVAFYYKNVVKAEKTGERQVTFSFDTKNNRELPLIMGQLLVLPKHYWTAKDSDGDTRDLLKTTLEAPLGSGPYKIKSVKAGRSISYERVDDYWAKDLPVTRGQYNFDEIRFEYFRDQTVSFEAFKANQVDYFFETSSKNWATAYKFKAVDDGNLKQMKVPTTTVEGMQGYVFNTRRSKFQDPRVRQAFNLVHDFEWANKNLFYGQYTRLPSYFANSELAATGLPEGKELEILNEVKADIPPNVFTEKYTNPQVRGPRDFRTNLRKATRLIKEAGWSLKNKILTNNKTGEVMDIEFLLVSPAFERVVLPFSRNLQRLGVKSRVRVIDSAQYKRRLDNFDFDIVVGSFGQSLSPGNEQRYFWGSEAADKPGSRNLIGIKNPVIDKLIDKVIFAKDRPELVAATRALDRVLLWNHYVVPQWYVSYNRIAYWDKFDHPKSIPVVPLSCDDNCLQVTKKKSGIVPVLTDGFITTWWYDKDRAQKLSDNR